jgi:IS30 family transposase
MIKHLTKEQKKIARCISKSKLTISRKLKHDKIDARELSTRISERKYKERHKTKSKNIWLTQYIKRCVDNNISNDYNSEQITNKAKLEGK